MLEFNEHVRQIAEEELLKENQKKKQQKQQQQKQMIQISDDQTVITGQTKTTKLSMILQGTNDYKKYNNKQRKERIRKYDIFAANSKVTCSFLAVKQAIQFIDIRKKIKEAPSKEEELYHRVVEQYYWIFLNNQTKNSPNQQKFVDHFQYIIHLLQNKVKICEQQFDVYDQVLMVLFNKFNEVPQKTEEIESALLCFGFDQGNFSYQFFNEFI